MGLAGAAGGFTEEDAAAEAFATEALASEVLPRRDVFRNGLVCLATLSHSARSSSLSTRLRGGGGSDGGPTMWADLMDELREIHLGLKPKHRAGPSVGERLQAAYGKVMANKAKG